MIIGIRYTRRRGSLLPRDVRLSLGASKPARRPKPPALLQLGLALVPPSLRPLAEPVLRLLIAGPRR